MVNWVNRGVLNIITFAGKSPICFFGRNSSAPHIHLRLGCVSRIVLHYDNNFGKNQGIFQFLRS